MLLGRIPEFDAHRDDWRIYIERLEQFFKANKIPTELQVPTLITVMGPASFELLVNLCTPEMPSTKTFEELAFIMGRYLQSGRSLLCERYKFRNCRQLPNENISEYVDVLSKMSKRCAFGVSYDENLRDQFVCGIKSESIRQKLFAETEMDFLKAYSLALCMEAAEILAGGEYVPCGLPQSVQSVPATSTRPVALVCQECDKDQLEVPSERYRGYSQPGDFLTTSPQLTQRFSVEDDREDPIQISSDSDDSDEVNSRGESR